MTKQERIFIFGGGIIVGTFAGFIMGMFFYNLMITASIVDIAEGLEGTNFEINIDFNETQIVERTYEIFEDEIKKQEINIGIRNCTKDTTGRNC